MPSLPAAVGATPSSPSPSPSPLPQGNAKVTGLDGALVGPRAASTSPASGTPPSISNKTLRVANTASTKSLEDVSSTLSSLDVGSSPKDFASPRASGKKRPPAPPADVCSPLLSPRSPPPSPDGPTPPSPSSPPASSAPAPPAKRPKRKLFDDEDDADRIQAANAMIKLIAASRVIINKHSTAVPVLPNGAAADAAKSNFQVVQPDAKYTLIIEGVGEMDYNQYLLYFSMNKGVPATSKITVRSGTAQLVYDTYDEWHAASKHIWSVGKAYLPPGFDPTQDHDVYFRICFSANNFQIDNLHPRVKALFATFDIDVTQAQPTKNPGIMQAYIRTIADWLRYEDLRLERQIFSIPAFGRDNFPTIICPIPALSATNHSDIVRLFVGKVPPGAEEYLIRERFRFAASGAGFNPLNVIAFGAYRYPGSTKTSRYGYLHVLGKELAAHLTSSVIDISDGILEVAVSEEKPQFKRQRKD